jgi:hypothetical protein
VRRAIAQTRELVAQSQGTLARPYEEESMPLVLDAAEFQKRCAGLSVVRHQAGEDVLTSGSRFKD